MKYNIDLRNCLGWFYFTLLYPDGDAANKFISKVASLAVPLPGINRPGEEVPDSQVYVWIIRFAIKIYVYWYSLLKQALTIFYYISTCHWRHQVDPHIFPLYDAIVLFATGVNNSISNYTNIDGGSNISDFLRNIYYTGLLY